MFPNIAPEEVFRFRIHIPNNFQVYSSRVCLPGNLHDKFILSKRKNIENLPNARQHFRFSRKLISYSPCKSKNYNTKNYSEFLYRYNT